jgi:hypothetical protein
MVQEQVRWRHLVATEPNEGQGTAEKVDPMNYREATWRIPNEVLVAAAAVVADVGADGAVAAVAVAIDEHRMVARDQSSLDTASQYNAIC